MGHPDYQDFPIWHGSVINSGSVTVTSVAPVTVDGVCTNFASIYLGVTPPVNGVTVLVTFWDSALMVTQFSSIGFTVISGTLLQVVVPATGGFVTITVSTSQAGNQTVNLTTAGTNQSPAKAIYMAPENRIADLLHSLAASSTQTYRMPAIIEGQGYLYFRDTTGSGKFNVRVRRLSEGAVESDDVCGLFGSIAGTVLAFNAPPRPIDVSIFNTDAGAPHTYDVSCQILSAAS